MVGLHHISFPDTGYLNVGLWPWGSVNTVQPHRTSKGALHNGSEPLRLGTTASCRRRWAPAASSGASAHRHPLCQGAGSGAHGTSFMSERLLMQAVSGVVHFTN